MDKVHSRDSDVRTGTLERIMGGLHVVGGPLLGVKEETEPREGRKELTSTGTRRTRRRKRKVTEDI